MTKPTPLRLKDIVYPLIKVEAFAPASDDIDFSKEVDPSQLRLSFRFDTSEDGKTVTAGVRVKTEDTWAGTGPPYLFEIEAFGVFSANGDFMDENAQQFRRTAALTMLVSGIREQLANLTGRGPWGVAYLPMLPLGAAAAVGSKSLPAAKRATKKASVKRLPSDQ